MTDRGDEKRRAFRRWWEGKRIKKNGPREYDPPKLCTRVEPQGPPSMVYGQVVLHFEDGTTDYAWQGCNSYLPRKRDVEVDRDAR